MAKKNKKGVEVQEILNSSSRRATAQRTLLLDLIHQSGGHLDACELYQRAREKQARINLSTVYRNLQLFKKMGLIDERHFAEEHHHYESRLVSEHQHMMCLRCGKVVEFAWPVSQKMKADIGKRYDFDISTVEVNMAGLCSSCCKEKKR